MQDYKVELDAYHGPLDLLLYLIKREEVDIHDIPVARITEQYLGFLKTLKELDINLAGEFLVMAATLMEVKSAMLMPRDQDDRTEALPASEDPSDPRYELIQQLLAYKRFKDAAERLDEKRAAYESRYVCAPILPDLDDEPQLDIEDLDILKLVDAFQRVLEQTGRSKTGHEVYDDDTPIELHLEDIKDRLQREGAMSLQHIFKGRKRGEMVGLFLATLELTRQRRLIVIQDDKTGEISLDLRPDAEVETIIKAEADAAQRDPADPTNVEDYEWPDEKQKKRYARRQARRAAGEAIDEDEQLQLEIEELEKEEAQAMNAIVSNAPTSEQADESEIEKSTEE